MKVTKKHEEGNVGFIDSRPYSQLTSLASWSFVRFVVQGTINPKYFDAFL